jgi:hypothetical protein
MQQDHDQEQEQEFEEKSAGQLADAEVKTPADCFLENYFAGMRSLIAFAISIIVGGSEFISATAV